MSFEKHASTDGKKIFLEPIAQGTAIDHLFPGTAVKILQILSISNHQVTAAMNVESKKMGRKDIIFIAGKKLNAHEISKIALVGKGATVNLIENSKIIRKEEIGVPKTADGIIKCINPVCISNKEGIASKFLIQSSPLSGMCFYCETKMDEKEIVSSVH